MKKFLFIFAGCLFAFVTIFAQNTITVSSGITINSANGVFIVLHNTNLVNNGTFLQPLTAGTVKVTGAEINSFSGSGSSVVDHLLLNKPGGELELNTNISVNSELNFNGGLLNLKSAKIFLASSGGLTNENELSRTYSTGAGFIERPTSLNAPANANPGNLGLSISSPENLGATIIRRGHVSESNLPAGKSIRRYFDVLPTVNANLNAAIRVSYFDAELNALNENSLSIWKSADGISWNDAGADTKSTVVNFVEKAGINNVFRFTLSAPGNVVPVTFTDLAAKCSNGKVILTWKTSNETNIRKFDVERRTGLAFIEKIGAVQPFNSGNASEYHFTDPAPLSAGLYRIAAIENDGSIKYSSFVSCNCSIKAQFTLFPNPVHDKATLQFTATSGGKMLLQLYDANGRLLQSKEETAVAGTNNISIDITPFPAGSYVLRTAKGTEINSIKITKL